ncbi:Fic family protein [Patescibacteria group bacterium]|nr:Fic family protein [Patescibacteria group bacterium]
MASLEQLTKKQEKLDKYRPFPPELIKNLEDWFRVELTYTSNAIEGNTLTRKETAMVLEKGLTVEGKSINEYLEAVNYAKAIEFTKKLAGKKRSKITENDILSIHRLILGKIDDANAGRYRTIMVRVAGSTVVFPNSIKVPDLMKEFIKWLHEENSSHPAKIAADAHFKLVSIHPFVDGNGRTARLLMNLLLMQEGYLPALVRKEDRGAYINAIEKGQTRKDLEDYYSLIYEAVNRSLDIYLGALEPKEEKRDRSKGNFLKIGELAKETGELTTTIRYWAKEGLLIVSEYTEGGYQLFSLAMVERVKKIRRLQNEKRLTIREIKEVISA